MPALGSFVLHDGGIKDYATLGAAKVLKVIII